MDCDSNVPDSSFHEAATEVFSKDKFSAPTLMVLAFSTTLQLLPELDSKVAALQVLEVIVYCAENELPDSTVKLFASPLPVLIYVRVNCWLDVCDSTWNELA